LLIAAAGLGVALLLGALVLWLLRSPLGAGLRRWWGKNTPLNDEPVKE
jgi:hypothetical protein